MRVFACAWEEQEGKARHRRLFTFASLFPSLFSLSLALHQEFI